MKENYGRTQASYRRSYRANNATYQQNIVVGKGLEFVNVINQCFNIELSEILPSIVEQTQRQDRYFLHLL